MEWTVVRVEPGWSAECGVKCLRLCSVHPVVCDSYNHCELCVAVCGFVHSYHVFDG